jgi:hypothetical protein
MSDRTRPSSETREADARDAQREPSADRAPTAEEEQLAEGNTLDESVKEAEEEMLERGAHQKGEGRIS